MTRLYATGYYNRERGKDSPDYVRADCVRSGIHAALSDLLRIAQIRAGGLIQLAFATLFIYCVYSANASMVELFRFDLPRRIGRILDTYNRVKKKLQEAPGAFIYEIPD